MFRVPCEPSRLKEAYRLAVRMYHPDSNSKDKVGGCCWLACWLAVCCQLQRLGRPAPPHTPLPSAVCPLAALLADCLPVCVRGPVCRCGPPLTSRWRRRR